MKKTLSASILCMLCMLSASAEGGITLPRFFSSGMVLQRDMRAKLWGNARPQEPITVHFRTHVIRTSADRSGFWSLQLPKMSAGGPFTMEIAGSDTVLLRDIYIGDVWVCSGQSNMELPMRRVRPLYEAEIARAENPQIRSFTVPQSYDFTKKHDDYASGRWVGADPKTVLDFSAAAYFFARTLHERYHVPIGIINASLGGSPAESWMSEEALRSFPELFSQLQMVKRQAYIDSVEARDRARIDSWQTLLWQKDLGSANQHGDWRKGDITAHDSAWQAVTLPGYFGRSGIKNANGNVNGVIWFARTFVVPSTDVGKQAKLNLGRIVDADSVYINGEFVGTTSYQYPPRWYSIPPGVLKADTNVIVVRVISQSGEGGFVPDKPYWLALGQDTIDLKGVWRCRLGAKMEPLQSQTFFRWKPAGLFNAMLAPLLGLAIKGVVWYQGESNAGRAVEYRRLLPALIRDWRAWWKIGDIPFVIAQLPNYMEARPEPTESGWAMLREAQLGALSVPKTGLAVTIDLGEWNDIHPLNKKDVGERLAHAARKTAYHEPLRAATGPLYHSMRIEGSKIRVSFTETGSGLAARGGHELRSFAIAGADKKFVWAHATIEGNEVAVWSEKIAEPKYVRYAWADNPSDANLYNKEGLPASPFRTDRDDGIEPRASK